MKRMRSLVKVVNHEIDPDRLRPRRNRKLVAVPPLPGQADQGHRRIGLRTPGCAVEEAVRHVVVPGEFLDLRVDDVRLLRFRWQRSQNGARGGDLLDVDVTGHGVFFRNWGLLMFLVFPFIVDQKGLSRVQRWIWIVETSVLQLVVWL